MCTKRSFGFVRCLVVLAAICAMPTLLVAAEAAQVSSKSSDRVLWSWGADLRLRTEYFDDAFTLDTSVVRHEQSYQRYRARLFGAVKVDDQITVSTRLTWESWNWNRDSYKAPFKKGWVTSEGIIDQLNLNWKKPFGMPLTVTIGRQDILLGDGWLIAEGTPLDGSRTIFFDAARGTLQLPDLKSTLDFIYIDQAAENHGRLSTLNNKNIFLTEQKERSGVLYLTNKSVENTQIDAYVIRRTTSRVLTNGDRGHQTIVGSRVVYTPVKEWQFKGEGAYAFGKKNDRSLRAWGFLTQATYLLKDAMNNQIRLCAEGVSGDKPGTATDEQFDMTWGRYPRWSEIYASLFAPETRIAQVGNLLRFGPGWNVNPFKGWDVSIDYNLIWALENNRSVSSGFFSADGKFRGQLGRFVSKYRLSPRWTSTLLGEIFLPDNYYGTTKNHAAAFIRAELMLTF